MSRSKPSSNDPQVSARLVLCRRSTPVQSCRVIRYLASMKHFILLAVTYLSRYIIIIICSYADLAKRHAALLSVVVKETLPYGGMKTLPVEQIYVK
jgi:hypothetical protein